MYFRVLFGSGVGGSGDKNVVHAQNTVFFPAFSFLYEPKHNVTNSEIFSLMKECPGCPATMLFLQIALKPRFRVILSSKNNRATFAPAPL